MFQFRVVSVISYISVANARCVMFWRSFLSTKLQAPAIKSPTMSVATAKATTLLNRRFLRALTYTVTVLVLGLFLLLIANRRRLIHLDDYLKEDLVPDIFQPQNEFYIADITIKTCRPGNWASSACATPKPSWGLYGDVGDDGKWITINKDLLLGSAWFSKKYLSYKIINAKYYEAHRDKVVLDLAVASTSDCNIEGNKKCIPKTILLSTNKDKAIAKLKDGKKGAKRSTLVSEFQDTEASASSKRLTNSNSNPLTEKIEIPSMKEVAASGWYTRGNGLWVKFGPAIDKSIGSLDVLFGNDAVEPRIGWKLIDNSLMGIRLSEHPLPRISYRAGAQLHNPPLSSLQFDEKGKFKILQVADIHFSTGVGECRDPVPEESAQGCEADPRTLAFLNKVLDLEEPDFVALTGDQIFGEGAPDPQTALFKVLMPLISREIPYAIVLGNHDDESTLGRKEMMILASSLPYSMTSLGDLAIEGFGNYRLRVTGNSKKEDDAMLHFLDSHSYSLDPKNDPGYDYFKESQINWMKESSREPSTPADRLSMAFFHIPLPEYRKIEQPMVGEIREGVTAPKKNTGMRAAFGIAGVQVATCGHDHANDYCLLDSENSETSDENKVWLCFGGGSGEGGYGGYGGFIRRFRVFELDGKSKLIYSWKRLESNPSSYFDKQLMVEGGKVVNKLLE